jgi:serine/threonine protein phosphatase PrpC
VGKLHADLRSLLTLLRSLGDFSFKYPVRALVAHPEVHSHQLDPERDLLVMSVTDGVTDVLCDMDLGVIAVLAYKKVSG